MTNNK